MTPRNRWFLLGALVCCYHISYGQSTLTLSSATAPYGGTASLTLSLASTAGNQPAALQWTLSYPSASTSTLLVNASPAVVAAGKSITCNAVSGGYACIAFGMNANAIPDGAVATVSVGLGSATVPVAVNLSGGVGATPTGDVIPVTGVGGTVTPIVPVETVSSVVCNPTSMGASASTSCTIALAVASAGDTVTLSSSSTALSVPATVSVAAGSTVVTFTASSAASFANQSATIAASLNGSSAQTVISLVSSVSVSSVQCSPSALSGGSAASCTVTLSQAAPVGGTTVALASSSGALVVPASVSVPSGALSAGFTATAGTILASQSASVTATTVSGSCSTAISLAGPVSALVSVLQLHADSTEVAGVSNGSLVTPGIGPAGFTGKVVVQGTGSVNFTPAAVGNGVYFLNCCSNTNMAYYKFTGAPVGNIFNMSQGQVSFYLKSRYSFAQRTASAAGQRYAFDVRDGNGTHLFTFLTQVSSGSLLFDYTVAGNPGYYYVPQGTEDALFGAGVVLPVSMTWDGACVKLYLNNALVKTITYTPLAANWTAASNFDLGAYEYQTFGGYDSEDDIIDEFTVSAPAPSVSLTAPLAGTALTGTVSLVANASSSAGIASVQFQVDAVNLGQPVTGPGPGYTITWNTSTIAGGQHTITAVATDLLGNSATSSSVTVSVLNDMIPPVVTITTPAAGASVSGNVTVTANATDNVGVTSVQFKLDGVNLGSALTGAGPTYSTAWNTAGASNGPHTLQAIASDAAGNTATSSVAVTLDTIPPVVTITAPAAGAPVSGNVTVTANATDNVGVTSVQFKLDGVNLGSALTGAGPTYSTVWNSTGASNGAHTLQAIASDAAGNTATGSVAVTITNPLLELHSDSTEVAGVSNGSVVTPGIGPAGFTGTVVVQGGGSVNFTPAAVGNGVYFLNCCSNTNMAYYKFAGATVGNIFNMSQGQVSFYLKSRYSFAQRTASAAGQRYAFDVRDGNGAHLFTFMTQVTSGMLLFSYAAAGGTGYYYVPQGTENTLFGSGVVLPVTMTWDGTSVKLYLNNTLAKSSTYTPAAANWTAASVFDYGAYEYLTYGGYDGEDDVIDEFTVSGPTVAASVPVSITAPANGTTVSGTVTVSAQVSAAVGATGLRFTLDGQNLGNLISGAQSSYSLSWDTTTASNGSHVLAAVAQNAAGSTTVSNNVSVTVGNFTISGVSASNITSSAATINWSTGASSDSQVVYGTTTTYGSASPVYSAPTQSHSVTLTGLAAATTYHAQALSRDALGNLYSSPDFTFTTAAQSSTPLPRLQLHSDSTEVSGVSNGSVVTPSIGPAGFTGAVVVQGSGSVNFTPAVVGNGAYFLNCCSNTNMAYYKFAGATVGNVFNMSQGQVSFYLKSRYSFAQRKASAAGQRYAFDVRDGNGTHLFTFMTQVTSGMLSFNYAAAGAASYYYVPQGTEDALFGSGVVLQVTMTWDGTSVKLYLNNTVVKTTSYTPVTANWTAASIFDFGAYEYLTFGGYDNEDDILDEFVVM